MSRVKGEALKDGQVPAKDGYGQDAGVGRDQQYTATEQDGENRLAPADVINDRTRVMDNE